MTHWSIPDYAYRHLPFLFWLPFHVTMLLNDQFAAIKDRTVWVFFNIFRVFAGQKKPPFFRFDKLKFLKPPNRNFGGFYAVCVRFFRSHTIQ